jgi:hypothetical protein
MDCARIPLGTGRAFDALVVQPLRDLLWGCSTHELSKHSLDDRCFVWLNLSLTGGDGCAGDRPHYPVAVAQSAARFSRLDPSSEAPTSLIREVFQEQCVHRSLEADMQVGNFPFAQCENAHA